MKKLIALAVIAAGQLGKDSPEVPVGASFEVADETAVTAMVEAGTAKLDGPIVPKTAKMYKARLLVNCELGKVNEVVLLDDIALKAASKDGIVDDSKAAVTYAESLAVKQQRPA